MQEKQVMRQYAELIESQYPGFLSTLVDPEIEVLSARAYDVDVACDIALQENDGADLCNYAEVIEAVRDTDSGIPLPPGMLLLTLTHGKDGDRRVCIPVSVAKPKQ